MMNTKKTVLAQLIARGMIFLLLFAGIFVVVPGLRYLFILFIIANLVLGFINHKRNILFNVIFIVLTPMLFVPILEYLITIILFVLTGVHLGMFWVWWRKGGVEEKEDEKKQVRGKKDNVKKN